MVRYNKGNMDRVSGKRYPLDAKDYKLYEEVGEGVSASVFRALCIPFNEIVAIKCLDLEKCNNDLDGIRREVQTMTLIDHPNLLRAHCSFTAGHSLWVVMPYMAGGSCLHIMKSSFSEGFDEPVIATLLRETLKALIYLHSHGHIHRDVKAGNILVDSNGAVKLADFGVSACMFDTGDRQRTRNTFVGTPCWMAPEVMQQLHGYDFKADIWSFGITALELAHGHAPFSKYPPMKVLLMTLQNAPPGLDYERDKKFSKHFKDMVATCLEKDPKKRPSSERLLKHNFFKSARSYDYLSRTILDGLSPLGERFKILKAKEADLLMQNKAQYEDKDQLSQQEYIRGISAWNFNLEDLKNQAALIEDFDSMPNAEDTDVSWKGNDKNDQVRFPAGKVLSPERASSSATVPSQEDAVADLNDFESSLASFPIKPLQALKGCFDVSEYDENETSPRFKVTNQYNSGQKLLRRASLGTMAQNTERNGVDAQAQSSIPSRPIPEQKKFLSGSLIPDNAFSPKKVVIDGERDFQPPKYQSERNYSGTLLFRQKKDTSTLSTVEDTAEGAVVQRKGRFKVTSADLSPKFTQGTGTSSGPGPTSTNLSAAYMIPSLQSILQHNNTQREEIVKLIKYVEQSSGKQGGDSVETIDELLQLPPATPRERELHGQVIQLQQSIENLVEELKRQKMRNSQLEKHLNGLANKEDRVRE